MGTVGFIRIVGTIITMKSRFSGSFPLKDHDDLMRKSHKVFACARLCILAPGEAGKEREITA